MFFSIYGVWAASAAPPSCKWYPEVNQVHFVTQN
jgi:hypothetical protein